MTNVIRPARPGDAARLKAVCTDCGLFAAEELSYVHADIDAWTTGETSRQWLLADRDGDHGAAMVAPEEMSDNVWNMLFLGVAASGQRRGIGRALLAAVESMVRDRSGRLLLIDTASTEDFTPARTLYASAGYRQEAVIREYYGDGIDRVTFAKRLAVG
ncbi:MAG: GNAT family N-acetyltransferase [Pseudomonadota bacterium]